MTSKFTISGDQTTITFSWTAPTEKIVSIVGDCSEYLFDHGYGDHGTEEEQIVFADLNNNQKLQLVEAHLKDVIINASNTFKSIKAQDAARDAEELNKYEL
jgi:hypothetical protein